MIPSPPPPSKNHTPLIITSAHTRFAAIYLLLILLIITFWLFFGALTVEVRGKGIFMDKGGLFDIESLTYGTVTKILVKPHDYVKQGDPVLIVNNDLETELQFATHQFNQLEAIYHNLKDKYAIEDKKNKEAINKQIASNKRKIEKLEKELPELENSYTNKLTLSQEGLVSTSTVLDAEKLLLQRKASLEITKSTITTLQSSFVKTYREGELQTIERRLLDLKENKNILELKIQNNVIRSFMNARILEVLVNTGDRISAGKKVIWMEAAEKDKENILVYAFADGKIAKRIALGTHLLLKPAMISLQEHGSIIGEVISISPYIIPNSEIETYIHSSGLEIFLTKNIESPFLLTIRPLPDPSTISGLKWTSGQGAPYKVSTGSVCYISGVAYYERPIVRFLPIWRLESFLDWLEQYFSFLNPSSHEKSYENR